MKQKENVMAVPNDDDANDDEKICTFTIKFGI